MILNKILKKIYEVHISSYFWFQIMGNKLSLIIVMTMHILDPFKVRFRQISHINFKIVHLIIFAIKYEVYVINYFLNLIKQN